MYLYSVRYRRRGDPSTRVYRLTVIARDSDEARAKAAIRDPEFGSTVQSPKRRGEVIAPEVRVPEPRCRFCKRSDVIAQGIYTRVKFPDGIALVCDLCREKADEPDEDTIEWRGASVEVS